MRAYASIQAGGPPAAALRPYVASYAGFEISGFPAGVHLGVPNRTLTMVIALSEPLEVAAEPGPAPPRRRFTAMAGGLATRSVAIRHDGSLHGLKLSLTPLGARAIYGVPAAALAQEIVPLDDLLGPLAVEIVDRLRDGPTWNQRFAVLDDLLLRAVHRGTSEGGAVPRMRPELMEAWRRLVATKGRVRIDALAAELGWTRRHLARQFHAELGLTPKTVARILRFEHAHRLATLADPPSWADVSSATGYTDQAHLVRDWRQFTGHSPAAWRRAEVLVGAAE